MKRSITKKIEGVFILTITQTQKLEVITKFARKFADKNNAAYPALAGVYYAANGSVYVTNNKYILRIKNAHSFNESFIKHVVTGQNLYGKYPNVEQVFPHEFDHELTLIEGGGRKEVSTATKLIKVAVDIAKATKIDKVCNLVIDKGLLKVEIPGDKVNYSASLTTAPGSAAEEYINTFNSEYLFNAFDVFRYVQTQVLNIRLLNGPQPIVINDETNGIDVLIMPYAKPRR